MADLIGKPYVLGARGPDAYDCWGLLLEVYKRMGVAVGDFPSSDLSRSDIIRLMRRHYPEVVVPVDGPYDGAIVFDEKKGHVGVMLDGMVFHANRTLGAMFERMSQFAQTYPDSRFYQWRK